MDLNFYIMSGILGMIFFIMSFYLKDDNERIILAIMSFVSSIVLAFVSFFVTYWHDSTEIIATSIELSGIWLMIAVIQIIRLFLIPYSKPMERVERGN